MNDLDTICTGTLLDAARLIKSRELSLLALTRAMLARITRYDATLHSYITVTSDLALQQAEQADREIADGNYRGPLHGIPVGIKDLAATRGVLTTCASRIFATQAMRTASPRLFYRSAGSPAQTSSKRSTTLRPFFRSCGLRFLRPPRSISLPIARSPYAHLFMTLNSRSCSRLRWW